MPENWDSMRLKYAARINPLLDRNLLDTMKDERVPFLPMDRVNEDGTYSTDIEKPLNEVLNGYTAFQESDVIIAKITPCFENGKGAYLDRLYNNIGFGSTEFHVLRSIPGISIPKFIFYVTRSHPFRHIGEGSMIGSAGQKRVPSSFIENFHLELPRIHEQKSIVNFLDKKTSQIDSLIEKKKRLIELLKEYRTAIINHAVTKGLDPNVKMKDSGIEWIGEIPEHWEVCSLKYITSGKTNSIVDGPFGSSINVQNDYTDEGIPVVRTINITDKGFIQDSLRFIRHKKFEELKRHAVYPNDVLLSKVGTIGNTCLFPATFEVGMLSTTGSCKITVDPNIVDPLYLVFYLRTIKSHLLEIASANVQPFLNMETIKNITIITPPINEQKMIVKYICDHYITTDNSIHAITTLVNLLKEYRLSLISNAVTGKIDVREEVDQAGAV